jgi:hypothetical protein
MRRISEGLIPKHGGHEQAAVRVAVAINTGEVVGDDDCAIDIGDPVGDAERVGIPQCAGTSPSRDAGRSRR